MAISLAPGGENAPKTSLSNTHRICRINEKDYLANSRLRPWEECSTVSEFEPITLMTLTTPEDHNLEHWKSRHHSAGRMLPEIIASSLSKPLLYASVNAIQLLLSWNSPKRERRKRQQPTGSDGGVTSFTDHETRLLAVLMEHHRGCNGKPCFDHMPQTMQAEKSGLPQDKASKALGKLMDRTNRLFGQNPMTRYKALCDDHTIDEVLEFIDNPRQMKEYLTDAMDQFEEQRLRMERMHDDD